VRQYYVDGFYPSGEKNAADTMSPTAALLKATLINSATSLTGVDNSKGPVTPIPSNEQGWGRIQLDRSLVFSGGPRKLLVDDHKDGFAPGSTDKVTYKISGVQAGEPLKITLVWTDFPGTPDSPPAAPTVDDPASWSAPQLVNDLDLSIDGPGGTYLGNVFNGGVAATGGTADRRNNVEEILIATPGAGDYTITVAASHIQEGPQDFALVATGAWTNTPSADGGEPPSGTVPDAGSGATGGGGDSGCGCKVAGSTSNRVPGWLALALASLVTAARRRRR